MDKKSKDFNVGEAVEYAEQNDFNREEREAFVQGDDRSTIREKLGIPETAEDGEERTDRLEDTADERLDEDAEDPEVDEKDENRGKADPLASAEQTDVTTSDFQDDEETDLDTEEAKEVAQDRLEDEDSPEEKEETERPETRQAQRQGGAKSSLVGSMQS